MNSIDRRLSELKASYQQIVIPPDLEMHLRTALQPQSAARKIGPWVAATLIAMLIFGYSYDAVAYYSKKLLGYEQVVTGSVQELIAQDKGQQIDKSACFSDGVRVTFDGLIMDGKGFTTLVRYQYPSGHLPPADDTIQLELKGILRYVRGGGAGEIKGNTEYWVRSFDEEPMVLEKRMKLVAQKTINGRVETIAIPFILNREQAYVPTIGVKKINAEIETSWGVVCFDKVQISGLNTVVSGQVKDAKQMTPNKRSRSLNFNFSLINGNTELHPESWSISSNNDRDFNFEFKFAGLPELKKMKVTNIRFEENYELDKQFDLVPGMKPVEIGEDAGMAVLERVAIDGKNTVAVIRLPSDSQIFVGFFKADKEMKYTLNKHEEAALTKWEYVIPEQGLKMAIKVITRQHPVNKVINIE